MKINLGTYAVAAHGLSAHHPSRRTEERVKSGVMECKAALIECRIDKVRVCEVWVRVALVLNSFTQH